MDCLEQLVPQLENRQTLPLLLDGPRRLLPEGHGLRDVQLLPLGELVGALPQAAERLRDGTLARFRPRVLPGAVHVLGDGVEQTLLHRLPRLASLLGQARLRRGRAGEAAVRLLDDLDGVQLQPPLRRLAAQEDRLPLLELDLEVLLDVAVGEQAVLFVAVQALVVLQHPRVLQLPRLPHLVLGELLLLPQVLLGRLVVRELHPDARDPPDGRVLLFLALAHRVGHVVVVGVRCALIPRLQVIAGLLVHLAYGQAELRPRDADDLDEHLLVALHPVGGAGHHPGLLGELGQVAQPLLAALRAVDLDEGAELHHARDLPLVDLVQLHGPAQRPLGDLVAVLAAAAAPPAPAPLLRLLRQLLVVLLGVEEGLGGARELALGPGLLVEPQGVERGVVGDGEPGELPLGPRRRGLRLRQGRGATFRVGLGAAGTLAARPPHLVDQVVEPVAERARARGPILLQLGFELIDRGGGLPQLNDELGKGLVLYPPVVLHLYRDLGHKAQPAQRLHRRRRKSVAGSSAAHSRMPTGYLASTAEGRAPGLPGCGGAPSGWHHWRRGSAGEARGVA
mmetsp:Transcript_25412/g.71747  ORF Transcript_25412/g.71747 Transcript_25412/m.71747 type:complete len:565 (+) Transcript_25412:2045-3739(+)